MSGLRLCSFCVAGGAFIIRGHIGRVPGHTVHPVCVMIVWCLHHTGFGACTTLALVHAPHWLWCMHHARFGACTMPGLVHRLFFKTQVFQDFWGCTTQGLVHARNRLWCMHCSGFGACTKPALGRAQMGLWGVHKWGSCACTGLWCTMHMSTSGAGTISVFLQVLYLKFAVYTSGSTFCMIWFCQH